MARAMRASAERKPKAIRVSRRSRVFMDFDAGVGEVVDQRRLDAGAVLGDGVGQLDEGGKTAAAGPDQPVRRGISWPAPGGGGTPDAAAP